MTAETTRVAPQTGVQASSGKAYTAGLRLGFTAANANGGINGVPVRLVTVDDAYKPEETVRLAKELLVKESPVAFAATVGTANADALIKAGVLTESGVPLVGPSSGAGSVIGQPGIYSTKASYADEVNQLFSTLNSMGLSRVAVLYQDDGYGRDLLNSANALAPKYKIELVARSPTTGSPATSRSRSTTCSRSIRKSSFSPPFRRRRPTSSRVTNSVAAPPC